MCLGFGWLHFFLFGSREKVPFFFFLSDSLRFSVAVENFVFFYSETQTFVRKEKRKVRSLRLKKVGTEKVATEN